MHDDDGVAGSHPLVPQAGADYPVEGGNGRNVRLYRMTSIEAGGLPATFYPGSAIKAEDLNANFEALRRVGEESRCSINSVSDGAAQLDARYWNKSGDTIRNGDNWPGAGDADNRIATCAAGDDRWLQAGGGNIQGGAGITRTVDGANVVISVDLHGTDPGLELDGVGNAAKLRALGNAVTGGANPDITNGPSIVNVEGGDGVTIQGSGGNTITISSQTGAGGLTFMGVVDVRSNPTNNDQNAPFTAVPVSATQGEAWTVEVAAPRAQVSSNSTNGWNDVITNYDADTAADGDINLGDIIACTTDGNGNADLSTNTVRFVRIPVGGGFGNLQQVTNNGSVTTNSITLEDGASVVFENAAGDRNVNLNADDATASYNLTLPPAAGTANQLLGINTVDGTNLELEWTSAGGGATGGSTATQQDYVFQENAQTVRHNYTVGTTLAAQPGSGASTATTNAMSAGPITINNGVTVEIEDGSNWIVL